GEELRDIELRLRDTASELHRFLAALEAEPGRLEQVESELERMADLQRRFRCASYAELLERAGDARAELDRLDSGFDPLDAAERALAEAEARVSGLAAELHEARHAAAASFAAAVAAELHDVGMGEGEFH